MKRILFSIITTLAAVQAVSAQEYFERTYVSTDKDCYVAGERIWCSAFCFDLLSGGKLSDASSIAYLELVSEDGFIQGSRIALDGGRGAGYMDIPTGLPTGNYALVAFTAVNKNETGYDWMRNAKVISIFNTGSTDRNKKVEIVAEDAYKTAEKEAVASPVISINAPVKANAGGSAAIKLDNLSGKPLSLCISVSKEDGIASPSQENILSFAKGDAAGKSYVQNVLPEIEGEIITATLLGSDRDKVIADQDATAYISTPGAKHDTYTGTFTEEGKVTFYTYGIMGQKDLVCEVADTDPSYNVMLDIASPFVSLQAEQLPSLKISRKIASDLESRNTAMLLDQKEYTDTLYEFLPTRTSIPFLPEDCRSYNLDDYTRFNFVKEILVEIVPTVRSRGRGEKLQIQVLAKEEATSSAVAWKKSLVLLDGVPVFHHQKIMDYDASLLKRIEVWPQSYFFGGRTYDGVVNFVTAKGGIAYMEFGSNVRIVDFLGEAWPLAYTTRHSKGGKDLRQTIYWHPDLELEKNGSTEISVAAPDYEGRFRIVAEGVTSDGEPFRAETSMSIR